ncbi:MAG: regulatory protein RecX [Deferribacterales bacterium]
MFPKRKIRSKTPMDYALRVLTRKDYFESEMREKITEHFGREQADETIERLKEYGYVDDVKCRELLIVSRLRNGYGMFRIQQELKEKGADDDLNDMDDIALKHHVDREAVVADAVRRFLENKKAETSYELKQKCIAHFYRKGHPFRDIEKIIDREFEK